MKRFLSSVPESHFYYTPVISVHYHQSSRYNNTFIASQAGSVVNFQMKLPRRSCYCVYCEFLSFSRLNVPHFGQVDIITHSIWSALARCSCFRTHLFILNSNSLIWVKNRKYIFLFQLNFFFFFHSRSQPCLM